LTRLTFDSLQALSDVVESVIGAIFISDNFSPEGAQMFFDKILKPFYNKHITLRTLSHHPTKTLFEVLQAHGCQQFEVTRDHEPTEECPHGTLCSGVFFLWFGAVQTSWLRIFYSGHT